MALTTIILQGFKAGDTVNIADAFESWGGSRPRRGRENAPTYCIGSAGAYTTGKITEEQRLDVVRHACPGPGACGGMYTCVANRHIPVEMFCNDVPYSYSANTMSSCLEVLGMSLPYSSSIPAVYPGGHCDTSQRATL